MGKEDSKDLKTELNSLFKNYSNSTNWETFSEDIVSVFRRHSFNVDKKLVYQCLSFCEKNQHSFIKTLMGKSLRRDFLGNEGLVRYLKQQYPDILKQDLN